MKICYFGTYDRKFSKNTFIISALRKNGASVLEVNSDISVTALNTAQHFSLVHVTKRFLRKFKIVPVALKNIHEMRSCDAILVGYPGHFDIPFAYILAKLLKKPLFFDPTIILWTTFTENIKVFNKRSFMSRLLKLIETGIYKFPDIIFAETEYARHFFHENFRVPLEKLRVLYVGADDSIYKYSKKEKNNQDFNIIYYGLFIHIHGVDVIAEGAKILQDNKDIKFLFVGKGLLYEETKSFAEKNNLKNMLFFPHITENNALSLLQTADVFLGFLQDAPIVRRTIPNKVFQGLALGKAVITADTPSARSLFAHKENIYLVPPSNPHTFAKAVIELKQNSALREKIARNGYNLYKEKFTPKVIGKTLISAIEQYLRKSK